VVNFRIGTPQFCQSAVLEQAQLHPIFLQRICFYKRFRRSNGCCSRIDVSEQLYYTGGFYGNQFRKRGAAPHQGKTLPEVKTQFSGSGKILLKAPRTITSAFTLTTAAAGSQSSLDQEVNPGWIRKSIQPGSGDQSSLDREVNPGWNGLPVWQWGTRGTGYKGRRPPLLTAHWT
jgi:hypothetical protein